MGNIHHFLGQARDSLNKGKTSINKGAATEQGILLDQGVQEGAYDYGAAHGWNTMADEVILEEGKFHFLPLDSIDMPPLLHFRPWETDIQDIIKGNFPETPLGWISPFD